MITAEDFRQVSEERMDYCRALLAAGRYDAAMYLSGYALETALKVCICDTLGWEGFEEQSDDRPALFRPLRVHDLNMLMLYSGREAYVLSHLETQWNNVKDWKPEMRYKPGGSASRREVEQRLADIERIRRVL